MQYAHIYYTIVHSHFLSLSLSHWLTSFATTAAAIITWNLTLGFLVWGSLHCIYICIEVCDVVSIFPIQSAWQWLENSGNSVMVAHSRFSLLGTYFHWYFHFQVFFVFLVPTCDMYLQGLIYLQYTALKSSYTVYVLLDSILYILLYSHKHTAAAAADIQSYS